MDYRQPKEEFTLFLIYNSRNFKWTIDVFDAH